jgi:hypothetical protein
MLGIGLGVNAVQQGYALPNGTEPFAVANFKDGDYVYAGNSLSDFLTTNAEWGGGAFDPETNVIPGTGLTPDCYPVLAAPLTAALLASGFTVLVSWVNATNADHFVECTDLPGFNIETLVEFDHTDTTLLKQFGGLGNEVEADYHVIADSLNKAALTFTAAELAISVNGNPVATMAVSDGNPHTNIVIQCQNAGAIEQMAFYPPQADADLPMLSELS